jgi:hypothetical protein
MEQNHDKKGNKSFVSIKTNNNYKGNKNISACGTNHNYGRKKSITSVEQVKTTMGIKVFLIAE